jgi:hypothetical protein
MRHRGRLPTSFCRLSTVTPISGPEAAFSAVIELDRLQVNIVWCYVTPVGDCLGESLQLTEIANPVWVAFGMPPAQDRVEKRPINHGGAQRAPVLLHRLTGRYNSAATGVPSSDLINGNAARENRGRTLL